MVSVIMGWILNVFLIGFGIGINIKNKLPECKPGGKRLTNYFIVQGGVLV